MTTPTSISMRERLRTDYAWTARQKQVLELIARGRSNTEIADELGLSLAGAKWHVSEILSKLQADQREEAADYWRRYNGLAPRFERIFRGIAGGVATKWAVGSAAVLVAVTSTAVIVAITINQSSDEPPANSQPTAVATADAGVQSGATPTASGDTVNGVPVQKLAIGSPGRGDSVFPRDTAVFYSVSCYACDGAAGSLIRSYRDFTGTLRTDDLFAGLRAAAGTDSVVSWEASETMATIAATVCTNGQCGGLGYASKDAQQALWLSEDGGISWERLRDIPGHTWVVGVLSDQVVLVDQPPGKSPRVWDGSSGKDLIPPVRDGHRSVGVRPGIGLLWGFDTAAYFGSDGAQLFPKNPVGGDYQVHGRWHGKTYITWVTDEARALAEGRSPVEYLAAVDDNGDLLAVYEWPRPSLRIVGAVSESTLVASGEFERWPGYADSRADRLFAYETVIISLLGKVGAMPILELSEGMTGNENPFAQGAVVGPFARVNAGGDCLNVREKAATSGTTLGCYGDGVLLRDLGATTEADGVAWLNVATPDGREGWASAEFLER